MKTNLENYEERFVDYMEGQLSADEMREVEAFVAQHPELEEDFKLFCSTKLEPDTNVVYTKKETLMQTTTVVRPLYVRIVAAAACVALLIGIGIHFLKPKELVKQSMLAELTPIEAKPIGIQQETQGLRESYVKSVAIPQSVPEDQEDETLAPIHLVASMNPIAPKPLEWNEFIDVNAIEIRMYIELGERLAAVGTFDEPEPFIESLIDDQKEQALATLHDSFFGNFRQSTKTLYTRTVKTVMDVYYSADYRINEAKDQLMASR